MPSLGLLVASLSHSGCVVNDILDRDFDCKVVLRLVLFGSLLAADPPADEALDILAFFVFSCSIPFAWVAKMTQFNLGMMLNVAIARYRAGGSPGIFSYWELMLMVSPQNKDDEKAGVEFVWAKAFVLH
ncbi:uncharacterized protein F5891DRAFT_975077 [Suillus fuscotomentosus]|uniref:Uncharacterized protein n=1 Tax=Suillus fuscotomentosus TaxID=1912939 RepID=A0AAD4EJN3_9AGAM|nr:uncharacterized protein F5891DRAFT_975077 [Suillus fuscotomentosus]KAG1907355.1 hypothetical protein F5891DRAFT_975077 [Suillus fuscotomentosus]